MKKIRFNNNKGSQVVEFTLLLPLLLVITFGTIILGVTVYNKIVIVDAAREASRAEALSISTAESKVTEILKSAGLSPDAKRLTVKKETTGQYLRVTLTYKSPSLVPGLSKLLGFDWGEYFELSAASEFKKEQ